ncbi:MAG: ATP-binding cassette domain-containing protein [Actinomycetota bacterium]|nr:ATP-binding cassette domain-containing protein [Actinomycetota bacterium]
MEVRSLYREPERQEQVEWGALELHDVFKIFRAGDTDVVALRGLDLRVERGELVALLGPSGSGKSTLLHLAAGLDRPSAGEVRVAGRSLSRLDDAGLAGYRAKELALVFQGGNLWPMLSARENVLVSQRLAGREEPGAADEALALFGLADRAQHRAGTLSGGEQQRVAIAAAAARRAPLVLADEPTAELDEHNEAIVLKELERLRSEFGATVVVVTHSQAVAAAAGRVVEIRDGRVA